MIKGMRQLKKILQPKGAGYSKVCGFWDQLHGAEGSPYDYRFYPKKNDNRWCLKSFENKTYKIFPSLFTRGIWSNVCDWLDLFIVPYLVCDRVYSAKLCRCSNLYVQPFWATCLPLILLIKSKQERRRDTRLTLSLMDLDMCPQKTSPHSII